MGMAGIIYTNKEICRILAKNIIYKVYREEKRK